MEKDKTVCKYEARDGVEISLTFDTVKKYLVSGNKEAVTDQELMYFLGVCRSRGLNPFKKDAYLIKYGSDPAAIITSIDYFRSRARAQSDCVGWKRGIIVQDSDGKLRDSAGIILEGEKLIGGFFEAQPEGWTVPFRLEVNLAGYIKKTKDGRPTRFWQADNQPTMISKVAEGQGLRSLWPDEFQGLYEEAEIKAPAIDMTRVEGGGFEEEKNPDTSKFNDLLETVQVDKTVLGKYLELSAESMSKTVDEIKVIFADDWKDSWATYCKWAKNQFTKAPHGEQPEPETDKAPDDTGRLTEVDINTLLAKAPGSLSEHEWEGIKTMPGGWNNLKANYTTFIFKHKKHIMCAPMPAYDDMKDKWERLESITEPWPLTHITAEPGPSATQDGSKAPNDP